MLENFDPTPRIPRENLPVAQISLLANVLSLVQIMQLQLCEITSLLDSNRKASEVSAFWDEKIKTQLEELRIQLYRDFGE